MNMNNNRFQTGLPHHIHPDNWAGDTIQPVDQLPFLCVVRVGKGAYCSVYKIGHLEGDAGGEEGGQEEEEEEGNEEEEEAAASQQHWTETYFQTGDVVDVSDAGDSSSSSSSGTTDTRSTSDSSHGSYSTNSNTSSMSSFVTMSATTTTIPPDDDESEAHNPPHVGIQWCVSNTPMGRTTCVSKTFPKLDQDGCFAAYHPHKPNTIVKLEYNVEKLVDWLVHHPHAVHVRRVTQRITPKQASFMTFTTETLIHRLLTTLVHQGVTPHITIATQAFTHQNIGHLVMEEIHATLEHVVRHDDAITPTHIAGLYAQLCFTLHVLQTMCRFKHHDLHTNNVFLKKIDATMHWKGQLLCEATHFVYNLGDKGNTKLYIPNAGYIVKLGDFGLSSITVHGRRLQRLDMQTFKSGGKWGHWSNTLDAQCAGYDLQTLVGVPPFRKHSAMAANQPLRSFLQHMRRAVGGAVSRQRLRPLQGHVSTQTPMQVLLDVFVQNPGDHYNFVTPPPTRQHHVHLVELGDAASLPPPFWLKKKQG